MKYEKFVLKNEELKVMYNDLTKVLNNFLSDIDFIVANYQNFFEELLYLKHTKEIETYLEFKDSNGESLLNYDEDEYEFTWNNEIFLSLFTEYSEEQDLDYLIGAIIQESGSLSYQKGIHFVKLENVMNSYKNFFDFCLEINSDEVNKVFNDLYSASETIQELKDLLSVLKNIV